jgi:hypothetical protein
VPAEFNVNVESNRQECLFHTCDIHNNINFKDLLQASLLPDFGGAGRVKINFDSLLTGVAFRTCHSCASKQQVPPLRRPLRLRSGSDSGRNDKVGMGER